MRRRTLGGADVGRATVKDVSARAGVSPKTVSNVMNATLPSGARHAGGVELAMAEIDYVPSLSARGCATAEPG